MKHLMLECFERNWKDFPSNNCVGLAWLPVWNSNGIKLS